MHIPIIYQVIAAATTTFSKWKCVATKREWLLYIQGWPLNICTVPEQWCLYCTYVSDETGSFYQITRTYSWTQILLPTPS